MNTSYLTYNTNYLCKYKNVDEINNYKNISKTINNDIDIDIDIENELYRLDLLNIFNINSYNDSKITSTIDNIYEQFIENNQNIQITKFRNIMKSVSKLFMSTDEKFGLTILFSYEYLDNTHKCICELIQTNNINEKTLNNLEKII